MSPCLAVVRASYSAASFPPSRVSPLHSPVDADCDARRTASSYPGHFASLEPALSLPANNSAPIPDSALIAGSVLPIQRAEELLATLPGVMSARIIASSTGAVDEIHILTTTEVTPKQTVRNVESALIAHLGMRVSHKKISVATSDEGVRPPRTARDAMNPAAAHTPVAATVAVPAVSPTTSSYSDRVTSIAAIGNRRRFYFEDVEVRRSRTSGMMCRVTLRRGEEIFIGEAEGVESDRLRTETAARAAVAAVAKAGIEGRSLAFEGARLIGAFDREFVFVALTTRVGRDTTLLTGTAQVKDGIETATVLAVLDATNRWMEY